MCSEDGFGHVAKKHLFINEQMLGHSSIKVTGDIYCDVIEKKRQPADLMQNAFFGEAQDA